jgi:hypothetical protein
MGTGMGAEVRVEDIFRLRALIDSGMSGETWGTGMGTEVEDIFRLRALIDW